jgi:O-acetyl-ADP-ribose deacetylase (regulator of RNase III)
MHGCNMQGHMGSGIAKVIKDKWPYVFDTYKNFCDGKAGGEVTLGGVVISPTSPKLEEGTPPLYIANALTQEFWSREKAQADVEAIEEALAGIERTLGDRADRWGFVTVQVGCGLGGLDWEADVKPLYEASGLDWTVYYL